MDSKQFVNISRSRATSIASYINLQAPAMVVRKTLRFIDGNFRAQGWQGATFQPWAPIKRKGQILIKTGRLRRGTNYSTNGNGEVRFYNNVPYAGIHNRGGIISATANVRGFTRRRFTTDEDSVPRAKKLRFTKTQTGTSEVKPHTRIMKTIMPQRQFMPYDDHGSPVLDASIMRDLDKEIRKILTL